MVRDLKLSVVIPCYNEERGVRGVLERMPAVVDEVVVVDNNCTDRTAEVARSLGARVVEQRTPGYGAAYKAGLGSASGDVVITLDGDGTYPPEEIPRLVQVLLDRGLEFLSTCRFPLSDPGAYWVLLGPDVELRRTSYDLAGAAERFRATQHPRAREDAESILRPPSEEKMLELFGGAELR